MWGMFCYDDFVEDSQEYKTTLLLNHDVKKSMKCIPSKPYFIFIVDGLYLVRMYEDQT